MTPKFLRPAHTFVLNLEPSIHSTLIHIFFGKPTETEVCIFSLKPELLPFPLRSLPLSSLCLHPSSCCGQKLWKHFRPPSFSHNPIPPVRKFCHLYLQFMSRTRRLLTTSVPTAPHNHLSQGPSRLLVTGPLLSPLPVSLLTTQKPVGYSGCESGHISPAIGTLRRLPTSRRVKAKVLAAPHKDPSEQPFTCSLISPASLPVARLVL